VHALPTVITSDTRGTFVFWADADAADWIGTIRLVASGKRGDTLLNREVRPYTRVWQEANIGTSRPTREQALSVGDQSPFGLKFNAEKIEVEAGKKVDLKLQLERIWPEFKNSVTVIPLSFPGPFKMATFTIGESKTEAAASIEVQGNTRPGEYTIAVQGQAQVPFAKDPKMMPKPNTLVSLPSRPITVVVSAAKK
jgi:hypothetical protein